MRRRSRIAAPALVGALLLAVVGVGAGIYLTFLPSLPQVSPEAPLAEERPSPLASAREALREGDWRAAEDLYARTVAAEPGSAEAQMGWARALTFQYRAQEAIPHARRAVELAPRDAAAHAVLAQALSWAGNVDLAMAAARRSIDLDPGLAEGYALLAESFVDRYQLALARQQLERALALDPSGVEPLRVQGYLLETEGRYREAIEAYAAAIESAPRYGHLHFSLGNVYRAVGRLEEARASYRAAASLAPSDARPVTGLGLLHLIEGDYEAAVAYLEQASTLDPHYSTAQGQLGIAYYLQGNYASAQGPLERATQLERRDLPLSSYRHVLGWTYLRVGQIESAEREFQQALALNPDLEGAREGLDVVRVMREGAVP